MKYYFSYVSHTFDGDFLKPLSLHGLLSTVPLAMASIISSTLLRRLIMGTSFDLTPSYQFSLNIYLVQIMIFPL